MNPAHTSFQHQTFMTERLKLGGVEDSSCGADVVAVQPPVMNNTKVLFKQHASCHQDVDGVKLELKTKRGAPRCELHGIQMIAAINRLGLVHFGPAFIVKIK